MIKKYRYTFGLALFFILSAGAAPSLAAKAGPPPNVTEPAGINLGLTSFIDGFGPSKPGHWSYQGYFEYSHANKIVGKNGNENPHIKNPSINVFTYANQLTYTFKKPLFYGIHPGFQILVPLVGFDNSFGNKSPVKPKSSSLGIGDITFGAYFKFPPIIHNGRPVYIQRFEFDVIAPTGKYNQDKDLNPGANFTSLNPYWSGTFLPTPKLTFSWRWYYLYNFPNNAPSGDVHPLVFKNQIVHKTQAGQASWINFTAAYEVVPKVHIGINGYFFKQFTDDHVNGQDMHNSREQVLGIGPGVFWNKSKSNKFMFNFYTETAVRNRPKESAVINLHWIHEF